MGGSGKTPYAMWMARKLKEHTLLQSIARVNRLHPGKEYGLILDYSGVIQELDQAIDFYGQLAGYDPADPEGTFDAALLNARTYFDEHAAAAAALKAPAMAPCVASNGSAPPVVNQV